MTRQQDPEKVFRVPRPTCRVPDSSPVNTGRWTVVHGCFNLCFWRSRRVMDDGFLMGVAINAVFHAEDLRTDLGADFAADAAFWINSWYAWHNVTPSSLSDNQGWSESLNVWGQILAHLRVIAVAIGRKGAEIWTKQTNLQPVYWLSDRLLVEMSIGDSLSLFISSGLSFCQRFFQFAWFLVNTYTCASFFWADRM